MEKPKVGDLVRIKETVQGTTSVCIDKSLINVLGSYLRVDEVNEKGRFIRSGEYKVPMSWVDFIIPGLTEYDKKVIKDFDDSVKDGYKKVKAKVAKDTMFATITFLTATALLLLFEFIFRESTVLRNVSTIILGIIMSGIIVYMSINRFNGESCLRKVAASAMRDLEINGRIEHFGYKSSNTDIPVLFHAAYHNVIYGSDKIDLSYLDFITELVRLGID